MAEADLDGIMDYIAHDNPTKAEAFGQQLRDKTLPLAQHPKPVGPAYRLSCASWSCIRTTSFSIACWPMPTPSRY